MSSNRGSAMFRNLLLAGLAVSAAACATTPAKTAAADKPIALTPTQQYSITVTQSPDEILLAAHAAGLSVRQTAALDDLISRWRDVGGKAFTVKSPTGEGGEAARTITMVQQYLEAQGVATSLIHYANYDPAQHPGAPVVVVGFTRYQAEGPRCGRDWKDFTHTATNEVNSNFGCAVTANTAAMIANPTDLVEPRTMTDADVGRREVVLGKFRQGQVTSSTKDDQAAGAISTVAH